VTDWLTTHIGDCRDVLPTLDAGSVHCVVTSPPYWGLRDYGTATWGGGDPECDHTERRWDGPKQTQGAQSGHAATADRLTRRECQCGATRQDRQLGLEATPEEYVANMVAVFREVWRVLRDDGTVWLNLGDSYAGGGAAGSEAAFRGKQGTHKGGMRVGPANIAPGLKPKDLVGIPWRVAFALQADGWYLRSDIVWAKPNPMPESVTDRPTKAHEYLFLLSKSARYFYDADAVREDGAGCLDLGRMKRPEARLGEGGKWANDNGYREEAGRNIRSVWTIATQPYPGAHFAVFPEALVVPCVKAGTSERGVCPECGAPWARVVVREKHPTRDMEAQWSIAAERTGRTDRAVPGPSGMVDTVTTTGWRPTCAHDAEPVPATVLDPFAGSGTVGRVAERLSRRWVLIELNPEYVKLAQDRTVDRSLGLSA
jgi:DNA modification methylase